MDIRKERKMPVSFVFAFAGIKTGWDKRKEQKMPVGFVFAFAGRQAGIKGRNKKCLLVCVCAL